MPVLHATGTPSIMVDLPKGWELSITVVDAASGTVVLGHKSRTKLIPASNQKIITVVQALKLLGPEYRAKMDVFYRGAIGGGVLRGDIIIKGNGAIVFTSRFSDENFNARKLVLQRSITPLVDALKNKGIQRIDGFLRGESGSIPAKNARYRPASGLLFNENTVEVQVYQHKLRTIPHSQGQIVFKSHRGSALQFRVTDKTKTDGVDKISIDMARDSEDYWRIEKGDRQRFFQNQVASLLVKQGVLVGGQRHVLPQTLTPLSTLAGMSVREMIPAILTHSDNVRAELLYSYMLEQGKRTHLRRLGAVDGSGLSSLNRLSSMQVVSALRILNYKWPWTRDCFASPAKGGTLKSRYADIIGLQAKTGTLDGAISLSGYLKTKKGQVVFSILFNGVDNRPQCRALIGAFLRYISKTF